MMCKTCCPQYTIRQKCCDFKISKSQKKCLKKMTKYLNKEHTFKAGQDWQVTIDNHFLTTSTKTEEKMSDTTLNQLTVRLVKVYKKGDKNKDPNFVVTQTESFQVYKKYQMKVHKDEESKLTVKQWADFLCNPPEKFHQDPLESSAKYSWESMGESNASGENEFPKCLPSQTDSSSKENEFGNLKNFEYGAYHLHYCINGKIVAVSVIDILDHCLSSVYLYYDPEYEHLSLGTYTALYEIKLCQMLNIPYYYLGYYIHTCEKMKYKGNYKPSQLLCPVSLKFVEFTSEIEAKLNESKFSRLDGLEQKNEKSEIPSEPNFGKTKLFAVCFFSA